METFWESCGARAPLVLEVEGGLVPRATRHVFDRPFLLIGSGPRSDLLLDHPAVGRRHAYLQVVDGRPYCVDLDSRTGTHAADGSAAGGWVAPGRPMRIGPYSIRAEVGGPAAWADPDVLGPLEGRYAGPGGRPLATLEVDRDGGPTAVPVARTLTLVGRSPRCKIRLAAPGCSRFLASLLRTPGGTWAVDLRSTGRLEVDGACRDYARLEDGDEIRVGMLVARVGVDAPPAGPSTPARRRADPSAGDLRAILEQVADIQHQSGDQFRQAIAMITQMFGSMHRETMDYVREELEHVRVLAGEIKALREEAAAGREAPAGPDPVRRAVAGPRRGPAPAPDPSPARDPAEIHLIVGERLAAFDRERRGRWDALSRILGGAES